MHILIADTQPRVRFALRVLLERQPGIEVVGEAMDATSLLAETETTCPGAVLIGWELPDVAMDRLIVDLRDRCPGVFVIALSGRLEARQAAMAAGVDAFVSKSSPPEQLLAALEECRAECEERPGSSRTCC